MTKSMTPNTLESCMDSARRSLLQTVSQTLREAEQPSLSVMTAVLSETFTIKPLGLLGDLSKGRAWVWV